MAKLTEDISKISDLYAKRDSINRISYWYLLKIHEEHAAKELR